jgi:hypothetical protein
VPVDLTNLDHLKPTSPRLDQVPDVYSVVVDVFVVIVFFFFSFFKAIFKTLTEE